MEQEREPNDHADNESLASANGATKHLKPGAADQDDSVPENALLNMEQDSPGLILVSQKFMSTAIVKSATSLMKRLPIKYDFAAARAARLNAPISFGLKSNKAREIPIIAAAQFAIEARIGDGKNAKLSNVMVIAARYATNSWVVKRMITVSTTSNPFGNLAVIILRQTNYRI